MASPRALTRGMFRRVLRSGLLAAVGLLICFVTAWPNPSALAGSSANEETYQSSSLAVIPIEQQPFYGALVEKAAAWDAVVLDHVVGDSPKATLLNFYAVMSDVALRADLLGFSSSTGQALRREAIDDTNLLFGLAVDALDASAFPESVRKDMADEAAIQLKIVLDYVFANSREPIHIPSQAGMKNRNDLRSNPTASWRIPGTAITLTSDIKADPDNENFYFSASTVASIRSMYEEIRDISMVQQSYASPNFYSDFIYTPGFLVPPDWYLALPLEWRAWLEWPIGDQTIFQIVSAVLLILVYAYVSLRLMRLLFRTYREIGDDENDIESMNRRLFNIDTLAWRRVLIVAPVLPTTYLVEQLVDNVINFTGTPLVVAIYIFYVIWYVSASILVFFLFEALGRSAAEFMSQIRRNRSPIQLRRITSFVMPASRAVGMLISVVLIYRLLLLLGLPSNTVLAFSAVPGLAIGLGATKLIGNLFAGLSIQTDRPLRVGEFCEVGGKIGFVTKIGLRSMELQTLESRVTIPNSVADEATIVNYSRRGLSVERQPMQGLELRLPIRDPMSPFQLEELIRITTQMLESTSFLDQEIELHEPVVSLESLEDGTSQLIVFVMVELHGWKAFLKVRENLLVALEEVLERISLCEIVVGVSYSTTPDQLRLIPELLKAVVSEDAQLVFEAARLVRISAFSYDYELELRSRHLVHDDFEDSVHRLNCRILDVLADHQIQIPYPTQTLELQSNPTT